MSGPNQSPSPVGDGAGSPGAALEPPRKRQRLAPWSRTGHPRLTCVVAQEGGFWARELAQGGQFRAEVARRRQEGGLPAEVAGRTTRPGQERIVGLVIFRWILTLEPPPFAVTLARLTGRDPRRCLVHWVSSYAPLAEPMACDAPQLGAMLRGSRGHLALPGAAALGRTCFRSVEEVLNAWRTEWGVGPAAVAAWGVVPEVAELLVRGLWPCDLAPMRGARGRLERRLLLGEPTRRALAGFRRALAGGGGVVALPAAAEAADERAPPPELALAVRPRHRLQRQGARQGLAARLGKRFDPEAIVDGLLASEFLKDRGSLRAASSACLQLALGSDGRERVQAALRRAGFAATSRSLLYRAGPRFDIACMLARRESNRAPAQRWRYVLPDASPQAGLELLGLVEEVIVQSPGGGLLHDRRLLPLTSLGHAHHGAVDKGAALAWALWLGGRLWVPGADRCGGRRGAGHRRGPSHRCRGEQRGHVLRQ